MNKTIVFDFDGVIHKYSKGWQDGSIYDEPNMNVINTMYTLIKTGYGVAIVSTRDPYQIADWWNKQEFPVRAVPYLEPVKFWNNKEFIGVFNQKIPATVYIDDRAYKFDSDSTNLYHQIINYNTAQEITTKYDECNELLLLGLLKTKTELFNKVNKQFDEKYMPSNTENSDWKRNAIINIKVLDEWIEAVQKYL